MLRYAQTGMSCIVTVFCPIVFPVAPVLAFKTSASSLIHVGSGSLFSINPKRIVLKRILLSGYPYKSHGRKTTVRFMFFNREDIEWFKPIEIRTRYGRRGHIKEPLGTHGHMKCIFDGPIKSQDTALMPLYKRVFPKWNYDSNVAPYSVFDQWQEK